jgi:hypothetical protein
MTQVLFDIAYLDAFLERLGGESPIPLLVGVWALPSLQLAQRIHNEVPGIIVPEHVQNSLRDAVHDAATVGKEVARGVIEGARQRVQGIYVVAPFRSPSARSSFSTSGAQSPVDTARSMHAARAASHDVTGNPEAALTPESRREDGRHHRARSVDAGPPELPCRTSPRTARDRSRDRPWPYASSLRTTVVAPSRPGTALSGPFSG